MEAGAVVIGGHSVDDEEPKYGLSVMGLVHPDKILKNHGTEAGDLLIITKPLGTGIINTAIKGEIASREAYDKAVKIMTTLNKYAGEIAAKYSLSACTDITGFGLMGHAYEMASASKVTFRLYQDKIPYIQEAREYAEIGMVPEGSYNNRNYLKSKYEFNNIPGWMEDILFDPQTSGGLLISCKKDTADIIMKELGTLELPSAIVGEAEAFTGKHIIVS
jgi:selenide,water dikinase